MATAKPRHGHTHHHAHKAQSHHARHTDSHHDRHTTRQHGHDGDNGSGEQAHQLQRNPFGSFDLFGGPLVRLMEQNWSVFERMTQAIQGESHKFVNRRLQKASRAIEHSRDCERLSDIIAVQQEWLVDFARDYAEQTKRVAKLLQDMAEDGTTNFSHASSEIAEQAESEIEEAEHRAAA